MPGAFFGVTVDVDMTVLDGLIGTDKPIAAQLIKKHALQFESIAKQNAPVDTAALRNSISVSEMSDLSATISDGVEYGIFQELGVNHPYLIESPINIKGHWVYIKMHPGIPAHPFFTPAAEQVGSSFFMEFFPLWIGSA
jgi:hypothetical protein